MEEHLFSYFLVEIELQHTILAELLTSKTLDVGLISDSLDVIDVVHDDNNVRRNIRAFDFVTRRLRRLTEF